ncbi:MAG: hypothetical protein ACTHLW_11440 [Verrucomicrobiota bacterium]
MKKSGLLFSVLLASAWCVSAQVTVDLTLGQDQFLAGESMPLTAKIVNRSGQTLHLGKDQEWLSFSIESKDGYVVTKQGEVPVEGEFALETSKLAKKQVDVAPYFSFSKPGRYTITASVLIPEWNQLISSPPKSFDIIIGSKLWEQEVGLPPAPGAAQRAPELRRYTLHQANYLRKRLMLYVQISDSMGKVYKVFPIGPMLSFGQPEPQVDKFSNLHVLYQDGPRSFNHTVVDPRGTVLLRQEFDMAPRPRLKVNPEGDLEVVGGVRRVTSSDIPPPKPAENNVEPAKP